MAARNLTRATLAAAVKLPPAFGALSRRLVTVSLRPAEIGSGLRVRRDDLGLEWPADLAHLGPGASCTTVAEGEATVSFTEHLLAALCAAGLSDVLIVTDAQEIPLYDGSAKLIWEALSPAPRQASAVPWPALTVREPVSVSEGEATISATPAPNLHLSYDLKYAHPLIGRQRAEFASGDDFGTTLGAARTFATDDQIRRLYGVEPTPEIEQMSVIIYPDRTSDPSLPPDALARHKLLDLLGDLYLCGSPVQGRIEARCSGHALNHRLLARLLEQMEPA